VTKITYGVPHELPKAYEPGAIEARWAEYWVRKKLFHVETRAGEWPAATLAASPLRTCPSLRDRAAHPRAIPR